MRAAVALPIVASRAPVPAAAMDHGAPPVTTPPTTSRRCPPPLPASALQRAAAPCVTLPDTELLDDEEPRPTAHTPPPPAPGAPRPRARVGWIAVVATVVISALAGLTVLGADSPKSAGASMPIAVPPSVVATNELDVKAEPSAPANVIAKGKAVPNKALKPAKPGSKGPAVATKARAAKHPPAVSGKRAKPRSHKSG